MLNIFFHVAFGFFVRDNLSQLEEGSLHDGVDACTHADFCSQADGIDVVEAGFPFGELLLHVLGQTFFHFLGCPGAVEEESAAFLQGINHIIGCYIRRIMAGNEVCKVNLIG